MTTGTSPTDLPGSGRKVPPNGLELSSPAEAGGPSLPYGLGAGETRSSSGPARLVSFSELLGGLQWEGRTWVGSSWCLTWQVLLLG
jgi:hypothetical protein